MSVTHAFATEQADSAAREAEGAILENVRNRALRSEAAWRDMAAQALKTETAKRRREEASKAAAVQAEQPSTQVPY